MRVTAQDIEQKVTPVPGKGAKGLSRLIVTCTDSGAESLKRIVEIIKEHGNVGHSFGILIDSEDEEVRAGWDGDGSDGISDIIIEKIEDKEQK